MKRENKPTVVASSLHPLGNKESSTSLEKKPLRKGKEEPQQKKTRLHQRSTNDHTSSRALQSSRSSHSLSGSNLTQPWGCPFSGDVRKKTSYCLRIMVTLRNRTTLRRDQKGAGSHMGMQAFLPVFV